MKGNVTGTTINLHDYGQNNKELRIWSRVGILENALVTHLNSNCNRKLADFLGWKFVIMIQLDLNTAVDKGGC